MDAHPTVFARAASLVGTDAGITAIVQGALGTTSVEMDHFAPTMDSSWVFVVKVRVWTRLAAPHHMVEARCSSSGAWDTIFGRA